MQRSLVGIVLSLLTVSTGARAQSPAPASVLEEVLQGRSPGLEVQGAPAAEAVSMVRLLAAPRDFHGKRVVVIGFAHADSLSGGLYLHEDDFRHDNNANAVWLDRGRNRSEFALRIPRGRYVEVEGRFDAAEAGLIGGRGRFGGGLREITRVVELPRRPMPAVVLDGRCLATGGAPPCACPEATAEQQLARTVPELKPESIATVEAVKGPSAQALYGCAGGAIVITTRGASASPP